MFDFHRLPGRLPSTKSSWRSWRKRRKTRTTRSTWPGRSWTSATPTPSTSSSTGSPSSSPGGTRSLTGPSKDSTCSRYGWTFSAFIFASFCKHCFVVSYLRSIWSSWRTCSAFWTSWCNGCWVENKYWRTWSKSLCRMTLTRLSSWLWSTRSLWTTCPPGSRRSTLSASPWGPSLPHPRPERHPGLGASYQGKCIYPLLSSLAEYHQSFDQKFVQIVHTNTHFVISICTQLTCHHHHVWTWWKCMHKCLLFSWFYCTHYTVDLLHLTIHHPPPFFAAESLEMDPPENQCHEGPGMQSHCYSLFPTHFSVFAHMVLHISCTHFYTYK